MTAQTEVHCLMGGRPAAVRLLGIRGARDRVIGLARHRLAADLVPVPLRLRDGATVRLRPVPEDGSAVLGRRGRSSDKTLYRRFFRSGQRSRRDLEYLADADYVDHFAWVALDEAGVLVGEASYFRAPDGTDAEVSFWLPDPQTAAALEALVDAVVMCGSGWTSSRPLRRQGSDRRRR